MKSAQSIRQFALRFIAVLALSVAAAGVVTPVFAAQAVQDAPFTSDRLSVEVMGRGPDVIFVPGYTSSREVWREAAARLSATHRVHLVQLAGFAGEPWTHGDGPFIEPALNELARYAGTLEKPALIGHSMGGMFGLLLAQHHPDLLGRVMSVDSLPFFASLMGPDMTVETVAPMARQMKAMMLAITEAAAEAQYAMTAAGMTTNTDRRTDIVQHSSTSDREASATAMAELLVTDARPDLAKVKVPFWAVFADGNAGVPAGYARTLWEREYTGLPNVRLEAVENSRHFIMYDQPERLNALIDDFLKEAD